MGVMARLRSKLAWWLVGPHITLPEDGVYVVIHDTAPAGAAWVVLKAETFDFERTLVMPDFSDMTSLEYRPAVARGTFSGTTA